MAIEVRAKQTFSISISVMHKLLEISYDITHSNVDRYASYTQTLLLKPASNFVISFTTWILVHHSV